MRDDNTWWQQQDEEYQQRRAEVEALFDDGKLDSEYADYIMEHCGGDRIICNGDTLTAAQEDHYLLEDFLDEEATK